MELHWVIDNFDDTVAGGPFSTRKEAWDAARKMCAEKEGCSVDEVAPEKDYLVLPQSQVPPEKIRQYHEEYGNSPDYFPNDDDEGFFSPEDRAAKGAWLKGESTLRGFFGMLKESVSANFDVSADTNPQFIQTIARNLGVDVELEQEHGPGGYNPMYNVVGGADAVKEFLVQLYDKQSWEEVVEDFGDFGIPEQEMEMQEGVPYPSNKDPDASKANKEDPYSDKKFTRKNIKAADHPVKKEAKSTNNKFDTDDLLLDDDLQMDEAHGENAGHRRGKGEKIFNAPSIAAKDARRTKSPELDYGEEPTDKEFYADFDDKPMGFDSDIDANNEWGKYGKHLKNDKGQVEDPVLSTGKLEDEPGWPSGKEEIDFADLDFDDISNGREIPGLEVPDYEDMPGRWNSEGHGGEGSGDNEVTFPSETTPEKDPDMYSRDNIWRKPTKKLYKQGWKP